MKYSQEQSKINVANLFAYGSHEERMKTERHQKQTLHIITIS